MVESKSPKDLAKYGPHALDVIQTSMGTSNWGWAMAGAVLAAFRLGVVPFWVAMVSAGAAATMALISLMTYYANTRLEHLRLREKVAPQIKGVCSPLYIAKLRYIVFGCLIIEYVMLGVTGYRFAVGFGA